MPFPTNLSTDFAEYHSQIEVVDNLLRYQRNFVVKDVWVPTDRLLELRDFFRQINVDERNQVVLKSSTP